MFCTPSLSRPVFLLPSILLAICLILLFATEYRSLQRSEKIQSFFTSPEQNLIAHLHEDLWLFQTDVKNAIAMGTLSEQSPELLKACTAIKNHISSFLKGQTDIPHKDELLYFKESLETVDRFLQQEKKSINQETIPFQRSLGIAINAAHQLESTIRTEHKKQIEFFIAQNKTEKQYRFVFVSLFILSGLLLVIALTRNAVCMRESAEIARSAERFNAVFAAALQSTQAGIVIRNLQQPNEPILFINNAFTKITGYSTSDVRVQKLDFLFGWNTDQETLNALNKTIRNRETANFDILTYKKDGTPFWSEWLVSPVLDKNNKATHYIMLLNDITKMRETQEALVVAKEQAEHASAIKTNFLAVMSHEIRTPINGLMGVVSLLLDTHVDKEQTRLLNIAESSAQSLLTIISDILDYAKMEAGKADIVLETFTIQEVVQGVLDLTIPMATNKGLNLIMDLPEKAQKPYFSDPGRIRQILLNLISNAIKFTDKGEILVRAIHLLDQKENDKDVSLFRFEVIDTGIGITLADQSNLFKEFTQIERSYTRRFGGTGLGLAITRRLVHMLHGDIGVESKPKQGTKFWFILPLPIDTTAQEKTTIEPPKPEARKEDLPEEAHILLVEDNDTNRFVTSRYLMKAGYSPDVAATGVEAIEMVKTGHYDLIFMDISMPEMDGLEATHRIRNLGGYSRTVPIIALTAHIMEGDREKCLAAGMDDYLNKPVAYKDLLRMLSHWLVGAAITPTIPEKKERSENSTSGKITLKQAEIDYSLLNELKKDLGEDIVQKIIETFLKDIISREMIFNKPLAPENFSALSMEAHTIKSSAANCGLLKLSEIMQKIETAVSDASVVELEDLLKEAPKIIQEAKKAISKERKEQPS